MKHRFDELPDDAELLKTLSHSEFKGFAKEAFKIKSHIKPFFLGIIFLSFAALPLVMSYSITFIFTSGEWAYLIHALVAIVANFTVILVAHELLHGLAYKLLGSKRLYFGAILRKMIFYAASDQEYFNGREFKIIAWLPFVVISSILISGLFLAPAYWVFFVIAFAVHSLMCQGDFALILYMMQYPADKFLTMDSRAKKETYFYLRG